MDRIRDLRNRMDYRFTLIGIEVCIFIISIIYGAHGFTYDPLKDDKYNFTTEHGNQRVAFLTSNIYNCIMSGVISLIFAIVGFFSPALHEDSSMIIHSSLLQWVIHLVLCWEYSTLDHWTLDNEELLKLTRAGDVAINIVLLVTFTISIILSTKLLRRNNSVWPRSNIMKFFTLESPLVLARMIFGFIFLTLAANTYVYLNRSRTDYFDLYYKGFFYFISVFNAITSFEHFLSLFWGVPHRKSIGILAILTSTSSFIIIIINSSIEGYNFRYGFTPGFSVIAVLSLIHGILNLTIPDFISKVPTLFSRKTSAKTETIRDTTSENTAPADDGGVSYSRMFTNMLRSNENDSIEPLSQTDKLSLKELFKQSPSFFRNFLYLLTCTTIFGLIGYTIPMMTQYYDRWPPLILLCASSTVMLRTMPDFFIEFITRKPLSEPPLIQIFTTVVIEVILFIIGALGAWVTYTIGYQEHGHKESAGAISVVIIILHILHLRNYVRSGQ